MIIQGEETGSTRDRKNINYQLRAIFSLLAVFGDDNT